MNWLLYLMYLGIAVGGYLIGSINPAIIISYAVKKRDVRKYGSGNAGTSNMIRTFGWKMGILTFLLDVVKGYLASFLGFLAGGFLGACIVGCATVVGHNWPLYYGFKGGKGIAATLGVLLYLMPTYTPFALLIVFIVIYLTKTVSIGSLLGVLEEVAISFIFYPGNITLEVTVCLLAAFAFFMHRTNIVRLIKGTENKLSFGKKEK